MNIVFLHGSNDRYGASRVLTDDVRTLVRKGHSVNVCLPYPGPLDTTLRRCGATVTIDPSMTVIRRVSPRSAIGAPHQPSIVNKADIVVLWTLAMAAHGPRLRLTRKPYIVSIHERIESTAGRALLHLAAGRNTPTQVNSEWTHAWARTVIAEDAISLAYPVARPPDHNARRRPSAEPSLRTMLLGRVNGRKGHALAIEAVDCLRAQGYPVTLTLAGAPYPGQERHLAKLATLVADRSGYVTYVGETPSLADLARRCQADLLLMLSAAEPFGITPLEAWGLGLPTAGIPGGGAAESLALVGGLATAETAAGIASDLACLFQYDIWREVDEFAPARTACTEAQRERSWESLLRRTAC